MIIKLNIDVTKIDKNRLHKGAKGTYANLTVLLRDATDSYGNDGMIVEDVSQAERESGIKGTIIGNARIMGKKDNQPSPMSGGGKRTTTQPTAAMDDDLDDIPF
jgi:hypothetical protein